MCILKELPDKEMRPHGSPKVIWKLRIMTLVLVGYQASKWTTSTKNTLSMPKFTLCNNKDVRSGCSVSTESDY